ncbi:hypothetical protein CHUAL_009534 [Chamberlinius hualienensis]
MMKFGEEVTQFSTAIDHLALVLDFRQVALYTPITTSIIGNQGKEDARAPEQEPSQKEAGSPSASMSGGSSKGDPSVSIQSLEELQLKSVEEVQMRPQEGIQLVLPSSELGWPGELHTQEPLVDTSSLVTQVPLCAVQQSPLPVGVSLGPVGPLAAQKGGSSPLQKSFPFQSCSELSPSQSHRKRSSSSHHSWERFQAATQGRNSGRSILVPKSFGHGRGSQPEVVSHSALSTRASAARGIMGLPA